MYIYIRYFPTKDMLTPHPLSFTPVLMKDAQCSGSSEKSIFRFLYLSSYRKNSSTIGSFEYKYDHKSKNKNWKIDFSFVPAHSTSFV